MMTDSMTENRKEAVGNVFSISTVRTDGFGEDNELSSPPPPPMQARPDLQRAMSRAPPPLKRMSKSNSTGNVECLSSDNEDEPVGVDLSDSDSLYASKSKSSNLDSVVGKLLVNKQAKDGNPDFSIASTPSISDASLTDCDSALVTPPPLHKFVPPVSSPKSSQDVPKVNSEPSKQRRKQATPQSANNNSSESLSEDGHTIQVPDIDTLLTDCAVVTPVEVPAMEIESDEEDDEFRPMRVSSKGRVVKKPSWADAYTDHATTETEEEWTPERPGKPLRSNADSFRRRPPPVLTSSSKHSITHDDLHPSMVMENTPDELILPFKHGWIRELVIRNPQNEELRDLDRKHTAADAYYYAPEKYGSVKLRSLVRVADFLMDMDISNLTSNNFSFAKRSIYKPPEEFVRLAGRFTSRKLAAVLAKAKKSPRSAASTPTKSIKQEPETPTISPKTTPTLASSSEQFEVIASPAVLKDPTLLDKKPKNASLKSSPLKRPGTGNSDRPIIKKIKGDKDAVVRAKQFLITNSQPTVSPTSSPKHTVRVVGPPGKPPAFIKKPQPCSQLCKGVANTVPSVQCGVCLLLFHPECINWTTGGRDALFVCSICIMNSRLDAPDHKKNITKLPPTSKITAPLINQALSRSAAPATPKESKGRLVTIPYHVLEKIDTSSPFALKLNNETFRVDPSRLISTKTGVKIFIKNDQVLQPSEVPVKPSPPAPAVQKKYSSVLDCYNRVSSPKSDENIPESRSSDLDNSHVGERQTVKREVISPTSDDAGPCISSVRSVADPNAVGETFDSVNMDAGTETNEITSDGSLSQQKEMDANRVAGEDLTQIIADLMDSMLEAITCYIDDEQSYAIKKEKSEGHPLVQVSTNQLHEDALTSKLNSMNKPTDLRPTHARQAGSMSEILYEQREAMSANTIKTYGKQSSQASSDSTILRSLIPKTQSTHTIRPVNQNGGVLMLSGSPNTIPSTNLPMRPMMLGSSLASISSSLPSIPVTIVSNQNRMPMRAANSRLSTMNGSAAGASLKPVQVQLQPGNNTKYVLVNPSATGSSILSLASSSTDKPLIVTSVSKANNRPLVTLTSGTNVKRVIDSANSKPPKKLIDLAVKRCKFEKGAQTDVPTPVLEHKAKVRCQYNHYNLSFSLTGSLYGCLLKIFSHLSIYDRLRAGQVCKMWRAVSQDFSLNTHIDIMRATPLCSKLQEYVFKMLSNQVVSLKLGKLDCALSNEFMERVSGLEGLSALTLDCFKDGHSWLTEQHLVRFLSLPKLTSLKITGGVDGKPELATLDQLSSCAALSHLSLQYFVSTHIATIINLLTRHHADSLQSVECLIAANRDNPFEEKSDPGALFTSLKDCTNMRRLGLQYSRMDVDSCEAEYLKDSYSALLPECDISIELYN
ncbi:uncharacterized protein [Watersipora subatra]|uniref:uncharacterized protein n=1 Tax=Watersipora subatra TaxID=2589382 RepID=UPI00355B3AFA